MRPLAIPILALLAPALPSTHALAARVLVTVHGVRDDRGQIRIGVCRKSEFLSDHCAYHAVVSARAGDVSAIIPGVPPGTYAVAAYQDLNGSGRLDRGFFGMPKEDLGFSRNPSLRFGPPAFARCAVTIGNDDASVALRLNKFGP